MHEQLAMLVLLKILNYFLSLNSTWKKPRSNLIDYLQLVFQSRSGAHFAFGSAESELLTSNHICGAYFCLIHSCQWFYTTTGERKTWDLGVRISHLAFTFLASFRQSFWHVCMFRQVLDFIGFNRIKLFTDTFNLSPCKMGVAIRIICIDFQRLPSIQCYRGTQVFFTKSCLCLATFYWSKLPQFI